MRCRPRVSSLLVAAPAAVAAHIDIIVTLHT
jgi:hypothetical protein